MAEITATLRLHIARSLTVTIGGMSVVRLTVLLEAHSAPKSVIAHVYVPVSYTHLTLPTKRIV